MNTLKRRKTHQVKIDHIIVGSDAPVVVQSMTNTDTADAAATAQQVKELSDAGSEMVRITVNSPEAASKVAEIRQRLDDMGVSHPRLSVTFISMVRDCWQNFRIAARLYLNTVSTRVMLVKVQKAMKKFAYMIRTAAENDKAVRIGVNWGSLDQSFGEADDGCQFSCYISPDLRKK